MGLPAQIQVGAARYVVVAEQRLIDELSVEDRVDLNGQCDRRRLRIALRPGMAPDREAITVVHEVLHAITEMVGLTDRFDADQEEDIVSRLAPALLDVLRRNPQLVAYLAEAAT